MDTTFGRSLNDMNRIYKLNDEEMGFVSGILGYMAYSTSIGAIALGFGSYLSSPVLYSL